MPACASGRALKNHPTPVQVVTPISQWGTRTPNKEQFHLIKQYSLQLSLFPSFILTELHEDFSLAFTQSVMLPQALN